MQQVMPRPRPVRSFAVLVALVALSLGAAAPLAAESRNRAPGFETLPRDAKVLIMPTDIELFSVSAGGVIEPKADWTDAADKNFKSALVRKKHSLGVASVELREQDADDIADINALHAAIARSIQTHHFGPGPLRLPTKQGKLDWSMGEPVKILKEKTGADYALFTFIRDRYASAERMITAVGLAILGIVINPGGMQTGYASLVDLNTGRIVWFNRLLRLTGDLREAEKAADTLDALLAGFPTSQ